MNYKIRRFLSRFISIVIVMVMIVSSLPLSIFAGGSGEDEEPNDQSYFDRQDDAEDPDQGLISDMIDALIKPDDGDDTAPVSGAVDANAADDASDIPVTKQDPDNGDIKAAPPTLDRLSIARDGTEYPSGSSYVMADAAGNGFIVNYQYSNMDGVVLVVECLSIGADFAAIPESNDFVEEAVLIGQGKMALKFKKAPESTNCSIGFLMKNVALTNDQVLEMMDSNHLPTSRIAATEYTLPSDANIKDVLTKGEKHEENVLWEGSPYFNPDATVSVTDSAAGYPHSFKLTVSPVSNEVGSYTNIFFNNVCSQDVYPPSNPALDGYKNGSPRFALPNAYDGNGSLMEILSIRFYEPTDLVRLRKLDIPGEKRGLTTSDLNTADFNGQWNSWTVGERTFDADKNAYYYEITPKARTFNANTVGLTQYLAGMTLRWEMADIANALEADTSYLAEDTEIRFRLPGDGQNSRIAKVRGPEIITGKIEYCDLETNYGMNRYVTQKERIEVLAGKEYSHDYFTGINNGVRVTASISKIPVYTKPVTQEYIFPFQIEPQKITIALKNRFKQMGPDVPVLESITYNTWDDSNWVTVGGESIDAINLGLSQTTDGLGGSFVFPPLGQVKTVRVKWSSLLTWGELGPIDVETYFDFKVNHCSSNTCEDHLANGVYVQAQYREYYDRSYRNGVSDPGTILADVLLPGQTQSRRYNVETHMWFRIICPSCRERICPELIAKFKDGSRGYFNDGSIGNVGDIGFKIGEYGTRYDHVHDPKIYLNLCNAGGGYPLNFGGRIWYIRDNQMAAFLTGEFTALPKLSGWTVTYSAKNSEQEVYTNTITIPEITDKNGVTKNWLPLPEGYAFTGVYFAYEGEFDLSHKDENDTTTEIWLVKDIKVHRNSKIPYIEEELDVEDFNYGLIFLRPSVVFDITELADDTGLHCQCGKHIKGQTVAYTKYENAVQVTKNRYTTFSLKGSIPSNISVYQGEGIGDSSSEDINVLWDLNGAASFAKGTGSFGLPNCSPNAYPYEDISEAVYIELTDDEIVPDLENSYLWGYPVTGQNIISDIITVNDKDGNPHRFLSLKFVDGFVRGKSYGSTGQYITDIGWRDNGIINLNEVSQGGKYWGSNNVLSYNGHLYRDGNVTGPFRLAFKTIPGTSIGDHHPVGMIYYDFSDLISNYNAYSAVPREQWGGYDNNHTVYKFAGNNIVSDSLGLTGDKSTSLFYQDGSSWTVSVLLQQQSGVSYAPGKNSTFYDLENRNIKFFTGEENKLNAMISISGPATGSSEPVYDMTSTVVLPRKGKQIKYTDSETGSEGQTDYERESGKSTMDLWLRGPLVTVSNGTGVAPEIVYTTASDPLSTEVAWLSAASIANWEDVTGFKIVISVIEPFKSVNFKLNLKTDAKTGLDTYVAYSGGDYTYKITQSGSFIDSQHINLATWNYSNYTIDGFVFWDTFDESGLYNPANESGIDDVILTFYDASGNVINQAGHNEFSYGQDGAIKTANGGKFYLVSNSDEKGQYIKISLPETDDGSTPALTSLSKKHYTESNSDSDFDRTTLTLKLDRLSRDSDHAGSASAGFIKLPQIKAADIEMYVGESKSANAIIKEYVTNTEYNKNNILTNGTYKIEIQDIDENIATLDDHGSLKNVTDVTLRSPYTFTGVAGGKFTAKAVLTNRIGDKVSADFTVKVIELEDIVVINTWDDDNNRDGIRPDGVTVQLMKNGVPEGDPVVLSKSNNETYTWPDMLRIDDNNNEIEYSLQVTPIADVPGHTGYTQDVSKSGYIADLTDNLGGYKFTVNNVHIPEKVDLTVSKVWDDVNDHDKLRPGKITVELSDGTRAELNDGNNWTYTATDRYKYENGTEIKYSWTEVNVPAGYILTVNESGYDTTLVNTYVPIADIIVNNIWDDDNNRDGIRPDKVTVQLLKNGVAEGDPVVLNIANNETYTWPKMLRLDENNNEIEYGISATPIADVPGHTGYTQTVDNNSYTTEALSAQGEFRFTVTNVHIPERVERTVVAVWIDDNNIDGIRPGNLKVDLSDSSKVTIDEKIDWTSTVNGLYKYEDGNLLDYSWIAPAVPYGYSFSQSVEGTVTTLKYVHTRVIKDPDPTSTPTPAPDPTTTPTPAPTLTPTTTPAPSPSPDPSLTPTPTSTPDPTSTPTSTPTPAGKKVPSTGEKFGSGSPLTIGLILISAGIAGMAIYCVRRKKEE